MSHPGRCRTVCSLGVALLIASACSPTFAPPLRGPGYGAPGRLRPDERFEVGGAINAPLGLDGGPFAAVRVHPRLAVEFGAELSVIEHEDDEGDDYGWALGFAGLRSTLGDWRNEDGAGFVLDGEFGFGAGVGGIRHWEDGGHDSDAAQWDGIESWDRPAGGAYLGFGQAYYVAQWFAVFLNERVQVSAARHVPSTLWWSALAGVEFTPGRPGPVSLWLGAGVYGRWNQVENGPQLAPLGLLGLSLHL